MPGDGTRFLRPPLLDFEETAKLHDPQPSQPFPGAARSKEIEAEGVFCARHSHGRRTQVGSRSVDLAMMMAMRRISASRFLWCAWFLRWSTLEKVDLAATISIKCDAAVDSLYLDAEGR